MNHLLFFFAGVLLWTFLEYCIHRYLGHQRKKNPVSEVHLMHHKKGNYFAPLYKKLLLAVAVVGSLTMLLSLLFKVTDAFYFAMGLAAMYLVYEWVHFMFHRFAPLTYWGKVLRKHHFYHHFKNPNKNFGVTSRVWDRIFKTFDPAQIQLSVPERLATPWILKHQQSEEISKDYRLL